MKVTKQRLMEVAGIRLKESSFTKVTKDMWSKMSDVERANALLTAIKDPDEADSFIDSEWEALPSKAAGYMHVYNDKYGGLNEAAIEGDMLVLTLKVPVELFIDAARSMEMYPDADLEASPTMLKQLAATMEDDLDTWFGNNGGEWLEDGIGQNVYDDFLVDEETGLSEKKHNI
jgi:hypothetical protein